MIARFYMTGYIEVDLNKQDIQKLNGNNYSDETMQKVCLEEILKNKLQGCAIAGENELDINIDFDNLKVERDWNKYPGSIVDLDRNNPQGSPLGIYIDDRIPTTYDETVSQAMIEIGKRKKTKNRRIIN